jgi:hypothetical protein
MLQLRLNNLGTLNNHIRKLAILSSKLLLERIPILILLIKLVPLLAFSFSRMNKLEPKKEKRATNLIPELYQPLVLCLGVTAGQNVDDGCEDLVELFGCLGAEDE